MSHGESMEIPDKKIERYIAIRKLALESTNEGERAMAQKLIAKMQKEYPNIEHKATLWQRLEEDDVESFTRQQEPPHWSDVYQQQQKDRKEAEWKQKFTQWGQAATSAFSWAATMASQAFGIQEAKNLAMEQSFTTITMRKNASGSKSLTIRVQDQTIAYFRNMTEEQRATYCNAVAQRVASEMYNSL